MIRRVSPKMVADRGEGGMLYWTGTAAVGTESTQKDQAEKLRLIMKDKTDKVGTLRREPRVITVSSGKGGVGKTNIAINLAIAFAEIGKKVVVMDADLGLANVNVILGIIPEVQPLPRHQEAEEDPGNHRRHPVRNPDHRRGLRFRAAREPHRG